MKQRFIASCSCLAALFLATSPSSIGSNTENSDITTETVGFHGEERFVTPDNQVLTPAGWQVNLPGLRPRALALSPDHRMIITAGGTHELLVIAAKTGKIWQHVPLPADKANAATPVAAGVLHPDAKAQLSFTGIAISPDGSRIYLANVNGDIKVFAVDKQDVVSPLYAFALPPANAPGRKDEIPAGIALSADGKRLYVALNLSNRVAELDATNGRVLRTWPVGVAPYDIVQSGKKLYVSNWGGRQPETNNVTGPAGRGMLVRVDARSIASEGSVSIINLDHTNQTEVLAGLHAGAMALAPNKKFLVIANAGSDTLSVLDTRTDTIVETICTRQDPGDLFGAQPNALTFDKSGGKLFVCNGTQNAVAVFSFAPGNSKLLGLIPVGWFPDAIVYDPGEKQIYVANGKGLSTGSGHFNITQYYNTLSLIDVPSTKTLAQFTQTALANLRYPRLLQAQLPAREHQANRPVPERTGEPSVFQHVIYILKENRTYDQILGDEKNGNGSADLCTFGARVTPNEHQFTRDFVLLDNTYCSGMISADGHQWADTAIANDYVERSFANWPRSYPCGGFGQGGKDALAYSSAGFIWDDALAHGKTFRDYGEFSSPTTHWQDSKHKGKPSFADCYHDFLANTGTVAFGCEPDIEAMRPYLATNSVGWDLDVPDVFRAAEFIKELKQFEQTGNFPNFMIIWLPNDHTSGTQFGSPTPAAQVADNDLAFGQIVDAVSHSKFWTNTCVFAIEDDPQAGWDHVSSFRTTAYVISPYTKRHMTISTQYNQTSLLRTMELILGLPPMNQMDGTATPMFDCFTNTPDFTAYTALTNNVPLDEMNPPPKKIADSQLRQDAYVSARLPLAKADQCPEDVFNRILWRAMMGTKNPYPAWAAGKADDD